MTLFSIRFAVAGMIVGSFAMANIQVKKEPKIDLSSLRLTKSEVAPMPREVLPVVPREVKPEVAPMPSEVKPATKPEVKPAIAPSIRPLRKTSPVIPKAAPMPREVLPVAPSEVKPATKPEVKPVTAPPSIRPPSNFWPAIPKIAPKVEPKIEAKAKTTEAKDSLAKILGQLSPAMQFSVLADLDLHHGPNAAALQERIAKLDSKLNKSLLTGRNFSVLGSSIFRGNVKTLEVTKGKDGKLNVKILFTDGSQIAVTGIAATEAEIAAALKDASAIGGGAQVLALLDQFNVGLRTIERKDGKDGDIYSFTYEANDRRTATTATKPVAKSGTHSAPKK